MNVQLRLVRPTPSVAVVDTQVPQQGWVLLDLPRTLGGVSRSYGWTIGTLSARIRLSDQALGGAHWRAFVPPSASGSIPVHADNDAAPEPVADAAPAPESGPRLPRRIPESDIIFVGRKPRKAGPARCTARDQQHEKVPEQRAGDDERPVAVNQPPAFDLKQIRANLRSAPVPKIRAESRVPPWLAVIAAVAMIGASFYCGTRWKSSPVVEVPPTLHYNNAIG